MKYILILLLPLVLVLSCAAFGGRTGALIVNQEVYEGNAAGYRGPIYVQVKMSGGIITEIIVLDSIEDHFVGEAAIEELIDAIIELNSTDIDAVSGATVSSKGFLDAVNNAIIKP